MYNPLSPIDNLRLAKKLALGFCIGYTVISLLKGCSNLSSNLHESKIEKIVNQITKITKYEQNRCEQNLSKKHYLNDKRKR